MAALFIAALCAAAFAPAFVPRASAQSTISVSIQNFAFSPGSVTLVIGVNNTVIWTNHDSATHTVTADDNSWGSGDLADGATYTHTFETAGTFGYHCSIHQFMTGTVVVEAVAPATTSTSSTTVSSTTSTSTASASSTTTTSQTSSSTSTAATTSSTSSSSAGGIPEFPFQGALVAAFTLALMASYLVIRRSHRGRSPVPSPSS